MIVKTIPFRQSIIIPGNLQPAFRVRLFINDNKFSQ